MVLKKGIHAVAFTAKSGTPQNASEENHNFLQASYHPNSTLTPKFSPVIIDLSTVYTLVIFVLHVFYISLLLYAFLSSCFSIFFSLVLNLDSRVFRASFRA